MNAPVSSISSIITLYLDNAPYRSKDWRVGFRQALFVVLDGEDYNRFIEEITKFEMN